MSLSPPHPGLSDSEAARRLADEGYNELPPSRNRGLARIVWGVVREPMFFLLIGGGLVYALLGSLTESLLLLSFATLSVLITVIQEARSERVLDALRDMASPRALVVRSARRLQIASRDVVRDDVVVIGEGDRVPADATLLDSEDLLIDESLLTGESVAVGKIAHGLRNPLPIEAAGTGAPGEDASAVFAGTLVVRGSGTALVLATGGRTEMGKIGRALGGIETAQPHLQQQMRWLIRDFAIVGGVAGLLVVVLYGLVRGSWLQALLGGIAIGMSLLPEEFPLIMTVFMAMGAWRISRVKVLTRRASAIETLGATTVLCTDKTGTLTQNRMTVVSIVTADLRWSPNDVAGPAAVTSVVLDAARWACPRDTTDPMDLAIDALSTAWTKTAAPGGRTRVRAYGLRPDLFAVVNVVSAGPGEPLVAYAKGAIEAVGTLCRLDAVALRPISAQVEALAASGIRVLAVASATALDEQSAAKLPDDPRGMNFDYLGLIGFADPLRASVPDAVAECRAAGIRVLMITGDYPTTASAIGRQAGLHSTEVLSGDAIESMSDGDLAERVKVVSMFARIRPNQKLRIVEALKANGDIVAMTGDGVNDAPAIKAAHIGIAMGGRGTEVAREASSIVLLEDDFGSIVTTIRLGRRIYDNLRKAVEYVVAVHIPIAGLAVLPLLMGLPLILAPIHIAFLEMIIDPACSMVFEAEPEEDDVMRRPPRDPRAPLLLRSRVLWAVAQGLIAFLILGTLLITTSRAGMPEGDIRVIVFTALVLINIGLILVNRSFRASLIRAFFNPNRSLWILVGIVVALMGTAVLWRPARDLFHFGRLHWNDLALCGVAGIAGLILLELLKLAWFQPARRTPMPGNDGRQATDPAARPPQA